MTVTAQEQRVRRLAKKQGVIVHKVRLHPEVAAYYNPWFVASSDNWLLTDERGISLDEAEAWLHEKA